MAGQQASAERDEIENLCSTRRNNALPSPQFQRCWDSGKCPELKLKLFGMIRKNKDARETTREVEITQRPLHKDVRPPTPFLAKLWKQHPARRPQPE